MSIGILTVLIGELIGFRPGSIILGFLGLYSIKLAWKVSFKLTHKKFK
jgi:hypothetical protein